MRSWKTRLTAFGDYCRVPQSKQDLKCLPRYPGGPWTGGNGAYRQDVQGFLLDHPMKINGTLLDLGSTSQAYSTAQGSR